MRGLSCAAPFVCKVFRFDNLGQIKASGGLWWQVAAPVPRPPLKPQRHQCRAGHASPARCSNDGQTAAPKDPEAQHPALVGDSRGRIHGMRANHVRNGAQISLPLPGMVIHPAGLASSAPLPPAVCSAASSCEIAVGACKSWMRRAQTLPLPASRWLRHTARPAAHRNVTAPRWLGLAYSCPSRILTRRSTHLSPRAPFPSFVIACSRASPQGHNPIFQLFPAHARCFISPCPGASTPQHAALPDPHRLPDGASKCRSRRNCPRADFHCDLALSTAHAARGSDDGSQPHVSTISF